MKEVKLKEKSIKIRRAKVKEIKILVKDLTTKIFEVVNFFFHTEMTDQELLDKLPSFIIENIEFFEQYILQFTVDFTQEELDDLEFLELIDLIKEIIVYNGISEKTLENFFQAYRTAQQTQDQTNFIEEIPKA